MALSSETKAQVMGMIGDLGRVVKKSVDMVIGNDEILEFFADQTQAQKNTMEIMQAKRLEFSGSQVEAAANLTMGFAVINMCLAGLQEFLKNKKLGSEAEMK